MAAREGKSSFFRQLKFGRLCIATPSMIAGGVSLILLASSGHRAYAYQVLSDDGWEVNLDTTLEYSNEFRIGGVSSSVSANNLNITNFAQPHNFNGNDGDQNFQHGMVSNEFEIIPILSVKHGNFGLHLSGQAFINSSYLQRNQNGSPASTNYFGSNNQNFSSGTRAVNGRFAQLLDAYVYDSQSFGQDGGQTVTFKVGRQTLLWGQSLFFSNNAIAAGQAPIDVNAALNLANPQLRQIFMPVGQAVLTYQPNDWLTLQGYYQFQWQPDLFPGAGSYLSSVDFLPNGSERVIAGVFPTGPNSFAPIFFSRGKDLTPPSQDGQFGASTQLQIGNFDLGMYVLRYDSKAPQFYIHPLAVPTPSAGGLTVGTYQVAYQRDIWIEGTSLSTNVGPVNVGGEISVRQHQDLYSGFIPMSPADNENSNPGYAVGDTLNANISAIYITPALPLMPGGATITAEIEANRVTAVTANKDQLLPGRTPNAIGMEATFVPTYYNIFSHTDVNVPLGITWFPSGRSEFDSNMNAGTGELNLGVTATYKSVWVAGLNYKEFLGSTSLEPETDLPKQPLADRSAVSFFIERTF